MSAPTTPPHTIGFVECLGNLSSKVAAAATEIALTNLYWDTKRTQGPVLGREVYYQDASNGHPALNIKIPLPLLTSLSLEGNDVFSLLPFIDAPNLKFLTLTVTSTERFSRFSRRNDDYTILTIFLCNFCDHFTQQSLSRLETLKIYDKKISHQEWPIFFAQQAVKGISNVQIYFEDAKDRVDRYLKAYADAFVTLGGADAPRFAVYRDLPYNPSQRVPDDDDRKYYLGWHRKSGTWEHNPKFSDDLELTYSPNERKVRQRSADAPTDFPILAQQIGQLHRAHRAKWQIL